MLPPNRQSSRCCFSEFVPLKMSTGRKLRALVSRRLADAAEEIFELFERTIAEYEAERRDLLAGVHHQQLSGARADVQQLLVGEAVPPERREWVSGLDQEDPEPPHIEEQVTLWTIQGGEQLQGLEEGGINFPLTSVTVKIEDDVELKSQSQFPEHQTEIRKPKRLKTEPDEYICGGSGSASILSPGGPFQTTTHDETLSSSSSSSSSESESDGETSSSSDSDTDSETPSSECDPHVISCDWEETGPPQSGSDPLQNNGLPVEDSGCVEGARRFGHGGQLQKRLPVGVHSGGKRLKEKPFSCSVCGRQFALVHHMTQHMAAHTGEKPFSCSFCSKGFLHLGNLKRHLAVHTGGKPFSCSVCGREFTQLGSLKRHFAVHTGGGTVGSVMVKDLH